MNWGAWWGGGVVVFFLISYFFFSQVSDFSSVFLEVIERLMLEVSRV